VREEGIDLGKSPAHRTLDRPGKRTAFGDLSVRPLLGRLRVHANVSSSAGQRERQVLGKWIGSV
jgi:hypothetical protein